MAGHVFIVRGDLTQIMCDAWLMPCGIDARPNRFWLTELSLQSQFSIPRPPPDWDFQGRRTYRIYPRRVLGVDGQTIPVPWLTNVGGGWSVGVDWFVEGVRQFLRGVANDPELQTPLQGRARPLAALPIVGTGFGGMRQRAGEVVRALLPCLYDCAQSYDIDIALVVKDSADYAAAQGERRRYQREGTHRWPELGSELRERADALARLASRGELVLFVGSGVSTGAGIPTWGAFLRELSRAARVQIDWDELSQWGYADQARILERAFGSRERMGEVIAERLYRTHYALTHGLLAGLPVTEFVTTNYDTLLELASQAIRRPMAVLPYDPVRGSMRWILKMHGCLNHPEDIVVTREDYLRYQTRRNALAGIVQALLITKHMLFVGFSLDDDNFHRIADEVRQVVRAAQPEEEVEPFGSSIVLRERPFLAQMWESEIDMISVSESDSVAEGARMVEIFLDYLVAQVQDPNHLLDARFEHLLEEGDAALRERLLELTREMTPEILGSPAWGQVADLLRQLGWDGRIARARRED